MFNTTGDKHRIMDDDWEKFIQLIANPNTHGDSKSPFEIPQKTKSVCRYSMLISRYPWIIILITPVVVVAACLVTFMLYDLPDFSDPIAGFEPRGTEISNRVNTWKNLAKATGSGELSLLSTLPRQYADEQSQGDSNSLVTTLIPTELYSTSKGKVSSNVTERLSNSSEEYFDDPYSKNDCVESNQSLSFMHCFQPSDNLARVVFESATRRGNLFSVDAIHSMCNLEVTKIRSHSTFQSYYIPPSWSLGNYIAAMNNRSSCMAVTENDVKRALEIIKSCRGFYLNGTLHANCWTNLGTANCFIPDVCTKYNGVYNVLHYLTDINFLSVEQPDNEIVHSAMMFLPLRTGYHMKKLYEDKFFDTNAISDGVTQIAAVYFDIKWDLFNDYLKSDSIFPVIAACVILVLIWLYTSSLFITLMTILSMVFSLLLAYFIYTVVFRISFFPFMNLCAVIILIGIGADDAFVFCDIWRHTKHDRPQAERQTIVEESLQHGGITMFVTSFTTAAAFFANIVSPITSVGCFSIYAGTSILCNFILTITWLPAVVSFHDRYFLHLCCHEKKKKYTLGKCFSSCFHKFYLLFSESARIFFDKLLPCIVIKLRFLWLLLLSALAVGAFVVVYFAPKLRLPASSEFQVFTSSHLLERYVIEYKQQFWFEKKTDELYANMPIFVVFGVDAFDDGDYLDPYNKGNIKFDSTFSISEPESQQWLYNFCQDVRNQTFYLNTPGVNYGSCFIETLRTWMSRPCLLEEDVCCEYAEFPYSVEVFNECIKVAVMALDKMPYVYFHSQSPGLRFDMDDVIKVVVLEFDSIYPFTQAYEPMSDMWSTINSWVTQRLKTAPNGLQSGWFVSYLEFYDLQDSLSSGTLIALLVSVAIAFAVMLLTTRNILISIFALFSILSTILVTVASLVLLGWELNILESITISVAVGLSIDFTVHYGVAYTVAPDEDRESRVVYSLSRMGSAIMMAAVTTFVAGALMMPSTLLSYTQLGTFLMLVMAYSWLFSTYYFQSLCRILGPQGNCGKIPLPWRLCSHQCCSGCRNSSSSNLCCKTDQTMNSNIMNTNNSTSSIPLESHELQPLTTDDTLIECTSLSQTDYKTPSSNNPKTLIHVNGGSHLLQQFHFIQPSNLSFAEVFLQGNTYITRTVAGSSKTSELDVLPNSSPDVPDIWIKRESL
ncbi:protein dispatched homolog 1-like [Glandiceps talaboti]